MRYLVTGGCGFIGSNLVTTLSKKHNVVVIDNLQLGKIENIEKLPIDFIEISAENFTPDISEELVGKIDGIFHLGIPSSSPMYRNNRMLVATAIEGFINIIETARVLEIPVVYASTSSLYNGLEYPYTEDRNIIPTDYYTEARYTMERLAKVYHKLHNVSSIGLRFFSVYGPHEEHKKRYANVISQWIWEISAGFRPTIYGDGSQTRDFVYVDDIVDALISAMKKAQEESIVEIYNVGTGNEHSFSYAAMLISDLLGANIKPKHIENPIINYVVHTKASTTKFEKKFGWKPEITLKEGIKKTINYYMSQGAKSIAKPPTSNRTTL